MSMLTVTNESLVEIDEALANLVRDLKIDEYGNRMNWRKQENLKKHINDLLDARLEMVKKQPSKHDSV